MRSLVQLKTNVAQHPQQPTLITAVRQVTLAKTVSSIRNILTYAQVDKLFNTGEQDNGSDQKYNNNTTIDFVTNTALPKYAGLTDYSIERKIQEQKLVILIPREDKRLARYLNPHIHDFNENIAEQNPSIVVLLINSKLSLAEANLVANAQDAPKEEYTDINMRMAEEAKSEQPTNPGEQQEHEASPHFPYSMPLLPQTLHDVLFAQHDRTPEQHVLYNIGNTSVASAISKEANELLNKAKELVRKAFNIKIQVKHLTEMKLRCTSPKGLSIKQPTVQLPT